MKRVLLAAGIALALGVTPIAAQTRVHVAVGFGIPQPYVTGVVIVGWPQVYYPHRRAFYYRPSLFVVRRGFVGRYRHHRPRDYHPYDRDGEGGRTRALPPARAGYGRVPDAAACSPGAARRPTCAGTACGGRLPPQRAPAR